MQAPSKTYFAVLGYFAENNIPRGKIYSTSKLAKSVFFGKIATEQLSTDIQIDDLNEEEETAGTPPLQVKPPVTSTGTSPLQVKPPSQPLPPLPPVEQVEREQNTKLLPPIPPASEPQSPNKSSVVESSQITNLPKDERPPEEINEDAKIQANEEKKDDSETRAKYTLAPLKDQLRPLINESKKDPAGNKTGITGMLSKIAGVDNKTEQNELFKSFIQNLYKTKIVGTNQRLYDVHRSVIDEYSSYNPVKQDEPRKTRVVEVPSTYQPSTQK